MSGINRNILGTENRFTERNTFTANYTAKPLECRLDTATYRYGFGIDGVNGNFVLSSYIDATAALDRSFINISRNGGILISGASGGNPATRGVINAKGYQIDGVNIATASAWARVNVNGSGVPSIANDFGFSSITDVGVGLFTLNFDTAQPNANYAIAGAIEAKTASFNPGALCFNESLVPTTTALPLAVSTNNGLRDPDYFTVIVFAG